MPVHLDIITRLNRTDIARDAEVATRILALHGRDAGEKWSRNVSQGMRRSMGEIDRAVNIGTRSMDRMQGGMSSLTRDIQKLGTAAMLTSRGLATIATPVAIMALEDLAQVAVTASQSLYLLPAAATAAAAGIGTLKLATSGFSDAIKDIRDADKFATALQSLSPNAQQAALAIRNLLPEFDKLKNATQDAFFEGMGKQIHDLTNQFLPSIQSMTTSIATSFNQMMTGIADQLKTPQAQADLQATMNNISTAFRELIPAAPALSQAFTDLMAVGSEFLPGLARDIANAARNFADFIREARESGKLKQWIQEGIDAVKAIASEIGKLASLVFKLFSEDGKKSIAEFKDMMQGVREVVSFLSGDFNGFGERISEELDQSTGATRAWRDAVYDIPEAFAFVVNKAVDMANKVKHLLDWMGNNARNFLDSITPDALFKPEFTPLPDIPHVPSGGNWGTALEERRRGQGPASGSTGGGHSVIRDIPVEA